MNQQNLNKSVSSRFLGLVAATVLICSCTPGSGSMMELPDTDTATLKDLTVTDAPVFAPSSSNPEHPLRLSDGKKTIGGSEILFEGTIETTYLPTYVFAWYENELEKDAWQIIYTRPYDDTYKEGKLTSNRFGSRLEITITRNTANTKTLITYLCTKETR